MENKVGMSGSEVSAKAISKAPSIPALMQIIEEQAKNTDYLSELVDRIANKVRDLGGEFHPVPVGDDGTHYGDGAIGQLRLINSRRIELTGKLDRILSALSEVV